jgi:hypothetical protein
LKKVEGFPRFQMGEKLKSSASQRVERGRVAAR